MTLSSRLATRAVCVILLLLMTGGVNSVSASVDLEYIRFYVYAPTRLDIKWRTRSESGNSLFELWRADSALGPYSLAGSCLGAGTSVVPHDYWVLDSGLGRNQRYFYYLTATDTAGNSEVVSDTVSGRTAPADITGFGGFPMCPEGYRVYWTVRYEYDVMDYIIRRGAWAGCSETIATVPSLADTDSWRSYQYIDLTAPPRVNTYCVTARRADSTTYTPLVYYIPEEPEAHVELDSFSVTVEPASVTTSWTTGLEYWLRCFRVQRRRENDSSYIVVAEVQGGGFRPDGRSYMVADSSVPVSGVYNYRLGYTDSYNEFSALRDTTVDVAVSVSGNIQSPASFALSSFPNPFNPSTTLSFSLPREGRARIAVFDLLGREVAVLADDVFPAGEHRIMFDGSSLPSGLYFARLQSGNMQATHKLLLLK